MPAVIPSTALSTSLSGGTVADLSLGEAVGEGAFTLTNGRLVMPVGDNAPVLTSATKISSAPLNDFTADVEADIDCVPGAVVSGKGNSWRCSVEDGHYRLPMRRPADRRQHLNPSGSWIYRINVFDTPKMMRLMRRPSCR
jgi:hypothetical protein